MIRKYPLAMTSLILGLVSFVHLFGLEKAVLAIVLGGLALKGAANQEPRARRYAYAGVILGTLYVVTLVVIAAAKGPGLVSLMGKLK